MRNPTWSSRSCRHWRPKERTASSGRRQAASFGGWSLFLQHTPANSCRMSGGWDFPPVRPYLFNLVRPPHLWFLGSGWGVKNWPGQDSRKMSIEQMRRGGSFRDVSTRNLDRSIFRIFQSILRLLRSSATCRIFWMDRQFQPDFSSFLWIIGIGESSLSEVLRLLKIFRKAAADLGCGDLYFDWDSARSAAPCMLFRWLWKSGRSAPGSLRVK